jgi:Domain of unknown function (DUF1883)
VNFLKFPLGYQLGGAVVVATLAGVESDVFLVDPSNLLDFERGRSFRYTGGHYKSSPVSLRVPTAGQWTAVVVPGLGGRVEASVEVIAA